MPPRAKPAADLFLGKFVKASPDACWLWTAAINNQGYGTFSYRRPMRTVSLAHRFSYEFYKGPIPDGLHVCHRCDTPRCVNPDHLFLGNRFDNLRDASNKKRFPAQNKTHCDSGHEFTETNTYRYPSGLRGCRECRRRWQSNYAASNPGKVAQANTRYREQKRVSR